MSTDHAAPCPETRELFERLNAAGVAYERVSLREALASDLPMFTYREGENR